MADDEKQNSREDLTPEEKLFRSIVRDQKENEEFFNEENESSLGTEGQDIEGGILEGWKDFSKSFRKLFRKQLKSLKDIFPFFVKGAAEKKAQKSAQPEWLSKWAAVVGLRAVNKVMISLVIALVIYLVMDMFFGIFTPALSVMESGAVGVSQEIALFPSFPEGGIRPLSHYLSSVDQKNAFFPPKPVAPEPEAPVAEEDIQVVETPPKVYRIVGISWDADGYVAMLQEEGGDLVNFVRKDDSMDGGVKVKEVTEFSVTLVQGGKQWELQ